MINPRPDHAQVESPDRILDPSDLALLFECPRQFLETGELRHYYSSGHFDTFAGCSLGLRWLDRSPLNAFDAFGASEDVLNLAHNATHRARVSSGDYEGPSLKLGPVYNDVSPRLGPFLGDYRLDHRTSDGRVWPAYRARPSEVWGALAERLFDRATELEERGQWLLLVEEERGTEGPRRDVEVGHDGRSRATRWHRPRKKI